MSTSDKTLPAKPAVKLDPIILPRTVPFTGWCVDGIIVSVTGSLLVTALTMLVPLLVPGGVALGWVRLGDLALALCGCSFFIYLLCFVMPIWLGCAMLVLQAFSGVLLGKVVLDYVLLAANLDPATCLGLARLPLELLLTFVWAVLPAFSRPLYEARFESSRWQNTPGFCLLDSIVTDKGGQRLSFALAWKRSCVYAFLRPLYCWQIITGAARKDSYSPDDCLHELSGTRRIARQRAETGVAKGKGVIRIRYQAFPELEKFMLQTGDKTNTAKQLRKRDPYFERGQKAVLLTSCLTGAVVYVSLLRYPLAFMPMLLGNPHYEPVLMNQLTALFALIPPMWHLVFTGLVLLFLSVAVLLLPCRPTYFELSKKGIRFLSNLPWFYQDRVLPWSAITRVSIEQRRGQSSVADQNIVFQTESGAWRRLRLGSVESVSAREEILKAIERWAPHATRDVEVIRALQPPCDYSYTALWLEALTAPPQRERLEPLSPGANLKNDQYTVDTMLGCGGQGSAYLCRDVVSGDSVVLKEFLLPVFVDVNVRRQSLSTFEQEARLLSNLDHPQVVELLDYFVEDHRAYLVLEHIDGPSLRDLVKRDGPLAEEKVLDLARQIADILAFLAGRQPPLVHRDISPDNLIVGQDGLLKLIDFNVAYEATDDQGRNVIVGKPAYMAPEQFQGAPTPQSDLYSLGATLAFLLTGKDPLPISTCDIAAEGIAVSRGLAHILDHLTQLDTSARTATASDALAELEQLTGTTLKLAEHSIVSE